MRFIDSIFDLQYYHPIEGVPCYCEEIIFPKDMQLQSPLDFNGDGNYTVTIYVYSADGVTELEDATSFFNTVTFNNPNTGRHTFSAVLNAFSDTMCANKCFILYITITGNGNTYFAKYTERYCVPECCEYVTDVTYAQGSIVSTGGGAAVTPTTVIVNPCRLYYIKIETFSDCYNAFSDKYYQTPGTVFTGTAFAYKNVTTIQGRIVEQPTSIERIYSLNCRPQQFQMQRVFLLDGFEFFPAWKFRELTTGFGDQYIFVEGERYEMNTNTPFETYQPKNNVQLLYNLKAELVKCIQKQIYGCNVSCGDNSLAFVQGNISSGDGNYYSESKQLIATDCDELMNYYATLPGVTTVVALDPMDYGCEFECGFIVYGEVNALIPSSYYFGTTARNGRIFGQPVSTLPDICEQINPPCGVPSIGTITITTQTCASFTIGTITVTSTTVEDIYLVASGDWIAIDAGTDASMTNGVVTFSLELTNTNYPIYGSPATIPVVSEQVAYIAPIAYPSVSRVISSPVLDALGVTMIVQPNGQIYYSGQLTSADMTQGYITLTDLMYII